MKRYDIIKIDNDEYKFIIFSTSYESPLEDIDNISYELLNHFDSKAKVLFDLLVNMGNGSERFVEALFDGNEFPNTTFKYISVDKKSPIREISDSYFRNNSDLLDNSILSSIQKKMLIKGLTI